MTDANLKKQVLSTLCSLRENDVDVVIVHGGGPYIKQTLAEAQIESEFIDGHRKTTPEAFEYVEMALKGKVNGALVNAINQLGHKAVGLSGKDGQLVIASKRVHQTITNGQTQAVDLGRVGDVNRVDPTLLQLLLTQGYLPVITCIAADESGTGYNINGDMFAGHIAGALAADQYVVLTDVDGIRLDHDNAGSVIGSMEVNEIDAMIEKNIIKGGMLPKIESCRIALENGARSARIMNGTNPQHIQSIMDKEPAGTVITQSNSPEKTYAES